MWNDNVYHESWFIPEIVILINVLKVVLIQPTGNDIG